MAWYNRDIICHAEIAVIVKEVCTMDIAGVSVALSNVSLQSQVSVAVLDRAMDTNEALGAGMVQMLDAAAMERSVDPNVGMNFDVRI